MNPSITTDTRLTHQTPAASRTSEDGATASRTANYIVDVVFIALLAAPFLIFEAPASIHDALMSGGERPAIVSAPNAQPAPAAADVYGPE